MSDIGPGDVVEHIDGGCTVCWEDTDSGLVRGNLYRVANVVQNDAACPVGLVIAGFEHEGAACGRDFRKIDRADEGFSAWMKTCRPKSRERTDA